MVSMGQRGTDAFWQVPSRVDLRAGTRLTIQPNRTDLFLDRLDAIAAGGLGILLASFGIVEGVGDPSPSFLVASMVGLLFCIPLLLTFRIRTSVSSGGIRLVGMVFVRDVAWTDVDYFDLTSTKAKGDEGLATRAVVATRSGEFLKLPALTFRGETSRRGEPTGQRPQRPR
jgi:hypothetical protein